MIRGELILSKSETSSEKFLATCERGLEGVTFPDNVGDGLPLDDCEEGLGGTGGGTFGGSMCLCGRGL